MQLDEFRIAQGGSVYSNEVKKIFIGANKTLFLSDCLDCRLKTVGSAFDYRFFLPE